MTKTEPTATAEFRFIIPDEINAWAFLLVGFTVQARHAKVVAGEGFDDIMKVSGPTAHLAAVKKALKFASVDPLTASPEALPTTGMQATGIFMDPVDIPDATTLFGVWGFQIVLHPEIVDEFSHLTAYAGVRGPSALDECEFFGWLRELGAPVGLDLDCIGADDGMTEWEHIVELPKQLQREFPDFHRRFLEGEFRSVSDAAIAAGMLEPYEPVVAN